MRSSIFKICITFTFAALSLSAAQAADNPFSAAPKPSDIQLATGENKCQAGKSSGSEKAGIAAESKERLKNQNTEKVKSTPAISKEQIKAKNADKIRSGFCGAGKCGGGKSGESIKETAPR